ncbi:substrate-binding periplasmic protein [Thermodesulforhabdus norvegica]|uniref:Solute-binding protein family 3/N-terminal domain-containing protein n=1 Tax=Thermodesulforhabdus norvegica TaxID=39841 RepID=A0A1I4TYI5_9BACT|nr:transporter substrate-binding domain-containing protein [Thermodesulforhabdus norvegica]SFM81687.1 conserved hypothetical protein [Thermodesulforhabdus norvegica]
MVRYPVSSVGRFVFVVSCFLILFYAHCESKNLRITIYYFHRPPFYVRGEKVPGGFLMNFTVHILKQSGIDAKLEEQSPKRILRLLLSEPNACSVGWFKTPDREKLYKFIGPFYVSPPPVLLVPGESQYHTKITRREFEALAASGKLTTRCGFSYGATIDEIIAEYPSVTCLHAPTASLVRMLATGRIGSLLIDSEELGFLILNDPSLKNRVKPVYLDNFVPSNPRYMMCSRKADPVILRAIDRKLAEVVPWLRKERNE